MRETKAKDETREQNIYIFLVCGIIILLVVNMLKELIDMYWSDPRGIGTFTGIIPKEQYKEYQDFHYQKAKLDDGKKWGTDLTDQNMTLL